MIEANKTAQWWSYFRKLELPDWFMQACRRDPAFQKDTFPFWDRDKAIGIYYGACQIPPTTKVIEYRSKGWPDGDNYLPHATIQASSTGTSSPAPQTRSVKVGAKRYTHRQLEHIGDAVLWVVARLLAHEVKGTNQSDYFELSRDLCSNKNLDSNPFRGGADKFEEDLGVVFLDKGFDEALIFARRQLQETDIWKRLERSGLVPTLHHHQGLT